MTSESDRQTSLRSWECQTRIFARHFLACARLPAERFSLLDVGCGLGDALDEVHAEYPKAELFGCDSEAEHVKLSTERNGHIAKFYHCDIDGVHERYNVIYISNVLEHVRGFHDAVRHLMECAGRLYILVPFEERIEGIVPSGVPGVDHVNSFDLHSFDFLEKENYTVHRKIIRTPGAWGHSLRKEMAWRLSAMIRGARFEIQREMIVAVSHRPSDRTLPQRPFFAPLPAFFHLTKARMTY